MQIRCLLIVFLTVMLKIPWKKIITNPPFRELLLKNCSLEFSTTYARAERFTVVKYASNLTAVKLNKSRPFIVKASIHTIYRVWILAGLHLILFRMIWQYSFKTASIVFTTPICGQTKIYIKPPKLVE